MLKRLTLWGLIWLVIFSAKAQLPTVGLIAYYTFNNSANDESGNRNNGQIIGGVERASDRFGNHCGALRFNGNNGFISVPNSPSLQSPRSSLSVTAWIKLEKASSGSSDRWITLICKGKDPVESPTNPSYRFQVFQGIKQSTISVNTAFTEFDMQFAQHTYNFNQWYFYSLVYDGSQVLVFLDGNLIFQFPYTGIFNSNNEALEIARDIPGSTEFFCGTIDDLRIYNRPLNTSEIQALYTDVSGSKFSDDFLLAMLPDVIRQTEKNKCQTTVNFPNPTVATSCGKADVIQVIGQPSGSVFEPGVWPVRFVATNDAGRRQSVSFDIMVKDQTPPGIHCPPDILVTASAGDKEIKVEYQTPVGTDNCPGIKTERLTGPESGSLFTIGNTTITFRTSDAYGNTTECSFKVIVKEADKPVVATPPENPPPTITPPVTPTTIATNWQLSCPTDVSRENDPGKCGAIVNYKAPTTEGVKDIIVSKTAGLATGSSFPEGNTINTWTAKDNSGSTKDCSFNVRVADVEKPSIKCPDDIIVTIGADKKDTVLTYKTVTATDNCNVAEIKKIDGVESGRSFSAGVNTITYKATDASGNSRVCSFNIIVKQEINIASANVPKLLDAQLNFGRDSVHYAKDVTKTEDCEVTLIIYDSGLEDNDTVSVIFNGKVLADRAMLHSRKANTLDNIIKHTIRLEKGKPNYLISKAWNTGKTWPNTMTIDIYNGVIKNENDMRNKKAIRKIIEAVPGMAGGIVFSCEN